MRENEIAKCLSILHLTPKEAARLLSVDAKTVSRWLNAETAIPGPAEQAVRAWVRFQNMGLPWRPDGLPIDLMTEDQIATQIRLMREQVLRLDEIIQRVQNRGGPAAPWRVDLERHEAELAGVMFIYFYPLTNGGFSPSQYRRIDKSADPERDWPLIEDAIACIAESIAKGKSSWDQLGRDRLGETRKGLP
jgi:hypothetical protein